MESEFKKTLNAFDAICMVVGIVIGSGIFLNTGLMAQNIASPVWILVVWLLGGLISCAGALTLAQLSMLYPQAGGIYVYLREAFGGEIAFLYGLTLFVVFQCGSIAAVAVGFAHYFGKVMPSLGMEHTLLLIPIGSYHLRIAAGHLVAIVAIWILTGFNYRGAKLGSWVQNLLTCLKTAAILGFVMLGAWYIHRPLANLTMAAEAPSMSHFGIALIAALWAYTGWDNLNYAAEEVKNPKRNIPLALLGGLGLVTLVYLLVNIVYVTVVPLEKIHGQERVAEIVMFHMTGNWGACFIAVAVMISTLGSVNGVIFASPRAYFAMARDGVFAGFMPTLHPVYHTPHKFLLVQGIWSSLLVFSGSYQSLFTFVMFPGFCFYALTSVALFILRHRHPREPLIWAWSYPVVPVLFLLCYVALAVNTLYQYPSESLAGMCVLVLALPHYLWKKANS